jgi:glycosyltransferase involved in cell wall biosynthesis
LALVGLKGPGFVGTIAGLGRLGELSGQAPKSFGLLLKWFARWVVNRPHTWLTVQNADDFAKLNLRTAEGPRVRLILGSGVNPERFPKAPFQSRKKLRFAMLSRMIKSKGVVEFVQAIRILQARGYSVEGHLIGKPDPKNKQSLSAQEITELVEKSGVRWNGHTNNPYQAIAGADIICLPTYYGEGIPKILLEAGCVGRPVVACDVPGPRDLVRNGIDGFLVPPQNVDDLVSALERFVLEPSIRLAMGDALRKRVLEDFSNRSILNQYLELYN